MLRIWAKRVTTWEKKTSEYEALIEKVGKLEKVLATLGDDPKENEDQIKRVE